MPIAHLTVMPSNFTSQSSFNMSNNAPCPKSTAFLDGDTLLFAFSGFLDDVDIKVDLIDDAGNGPIASDTISVAAGSIDQFTQFSGFPARPDGSAMDTCLYQITLTNDTSANTGTNIYVTVYRHT
jgi:hypothetical protein